MSSVTTLIGEAAAEQLHGGAARPAAARGLGPVARACWAFRSELVWVLVFSSFANVLTLTPVVYMLQLFDRVMVSGNNLTLITVTLLMLLFVAVMAFAEWVRSQLLLRAGVRLDEALNRNVFIATFHAQLKQPQRSPQQPLVDLNTLRQFVTGNGMFAFADTPWALLSIAVLFVMHPWLGWLAVAFCVLQLALALLARYMTGVRQRALTAAEMEAGQFLQAKLRSVDTVAAMGMQQALRRHWLARHDVAARHQAALRESSVRVQAGVKWMQNVQQAMVLSLGALLAIRGEVTVGAMLAANSLMGNALRPFGALVGAWGQAADAKAAWRRIDALLGALKDIPQDLPMASLTGAIAVRGLRVRVEGRVAPILDGIDADFAANETVAIVGPSGSGKSTLARCLLGIWHEHEGTVTLDGHDPRTLPRDALGQRLGYLPQDIEIFDGTVAQNIARFADAEPAAVWAAAKLAGVHEMVLRLPKGYDTPLGVGGVVLSGGQQQRLALARALFSDPTIVVLDEPNASLDDAGEAALIAAIRELKRRGATVFMIVHRQQLLSLADRLLILDHGRVSALTALNQAAQARDRETPL